MPIITVDEDKCQRDGLCVLDCPVQVLEPDSDGLPRVRPGADAFCIDCGHCVAICPHQALDQRSMAAADCAPLDPALNLNPDQIEQFLRSRRSIRHYHSDPVPSEQIQKLINLANCAPSGHNAQPLSWLVASGPEKIRELCTLVIEWMKLFIVQEPKLAKMLHMDLVVLAWEKNNKDRILRNAPHVVVAHAPKDSRPAGPAAITAAAYLELAAPGLGLGTCWAGYFNTAGQMHPPLASALGLPDGHQPFASLMLGRPKMSYHRLPLRKVPEIMWVD